jgi:hypothetical protein
VWAFLASVAAGALWRELQAERALCRTCGKTQAEQLQTLGISVVKGLEQSTDAISAARRQADILARLDALRPHGGERKTGVDR